MKTKSIIYLLAGIASFFNANAVTLKVTQIERGVPTFIFSLENALLRKNYTLSIKSISGKEKIVHSSLCRCSDGRLLDGAELFKWTAPGFGPGEPVTVAVWNGNEFAEAQFIPRPLQNRQNGYTITLQVGDGERRTFHLLASGFAPHEAVRLYTYSGDRKIWDNVVADQNGSIYSKFTNQAEVGGMSYLELQGSRGKVHITYPWGSSYESEFL
jgi:hypothetical protein